MKTRRWNVNREIHYGWQWLLKRRKKFAGQMMVYESPTLHKWRCAFLWEEMPWISHTLSQKRSGESPTSQRPGKVERERPRCTWWEDVVTGRRRKNYAISSPKLSNNSVPSHRGGSCCILVQGIYINNSFLVASKSLITLTNCH